MTLCAQLRKPIRKKITIKTLVAGDGRNFPRAGQRVRIIQDVKGVETEVQFRVFTGENIHRGFELALMAMSIGEKAKITISRNLSFKGDGVCQEPEGLQSFWTIVTLLHIE